MDAIAKYVVTDRAGCRVPVEGRVAAVEGVGQVGGNGVVRRRINVYNDRLVVVVNTIGTRTNAARARVQVIDGIIFVAIASPSPVEVEVVVVAVAVANEGVSAAFAASCI